MTLAPQSARILLVDDDPSLLVLLAEQLGDDGFQVTTARDGVEALRCLESGWPDILITDLLMPRMDGLTLARLVKERADLPIIVLSAVDSGDSKAEALDEVAEDYVTKPFHYPELRARINRVLRRVGDRSSPGTIRLGPDLTLELHRRRATAAGQPVALTPFESRLLDAGSAGPPAAVVGWRAKRASERLNETAAMPGWRPEAVRTGAGGPGSDEEGVGARSRACARQRRGRWSVNRRADLVSRPARPKSRRRSVFVVTIPTPETDPRGPAGEVMGDDLRRDPDAIGGEPA